MKTQISREKIQYRGFRRMFLCAYWTVQKLRVKMLKVPNFEADGRADEKAKSLDLRNMYYRDR